jgi:Holliday junction resolvase
MGKSSRDKGARRERELVQLHLDLGLTCKRVGVAYKPGNDIDLYLPRRDAPLICEAKARASGTGFKVLEKMLGENDILFLIRDRAEPLAVLPWRIYKELITR